MSDAFYKLLGKGKPSLFLNYLTLLYDGDQLQLVVGIFFRCSCLISVAYCVATKTFCVLCGASGFRYFFVIPLSSSTCRRGVQAKHTKSEYIQLVKHKPSNSALN